jgi:predicted negative regulator of RcsB-dependent stress response
MDNLEASFNEHQRTEQFKALFKKYGNKILTVIIIVLVMIGIWQYWQHHQTQQGDAASQIYLQLLESANKADKTNTQAAANELMQKYSPTPYAKMAAFALAKQAVKDGRLEEASEKLRWVIAHNEQAFLSELAQVRLAQILLSQTKAQAALDAVKGAEKIYPVETGMVRAQALLALDKSDQARLELQKAVDVTPADSSMRPILEMMLNDI